MIITLFGSNKVNIMQKRVEQIDINTGEVLSGCLVYVPIRPIITERWFMAFQDSFAEIAKDQDLKGETLRVLMYLYSALDFENFIHKCQKDIAEDLGMQRQHVSRAMRLLTSKEIVLESPKIGNVKCYRLNPNYAWKGKVKNMEDARRDRLKLINGGKE